MKRGAARRVNRPRGPGRWRQGHVPALLLSLALLAAAPLPAQPPVAPSPGETAGGVESQVDVAPDASDFRVVYDPGHPDADPGVFSAFFQADRIS